MATKLVEVDSNTRLVVTAQIASIRPGVIDAIERFVKVVNVKDVLLNFNDTVYQITEKGLIKHNGD